MTIFVIVPNFKWKSSSVMELTMLFFFFNANKTFARGNRILWLILAGSSGSNGQFWTALNCDSGSSQNKGMTEDENGYIQTSEIYSSFDSHIVNIMTPHYYLYIIG